MLFGYTSKQGTLSASNQSSQAFLIKDALLPNQNDQRMPNMLCSSLCVMKKEVALKRSSSANHHGKGRIIMGKVGIVLRAYLALLRHLVSADTCLLYRNF